MTSRSFSNFRTLTLLPRVRPVVSAFCPSSSATAGVEVKLYDDQQKEFRLKQIERAFDQAIPKLLRGSYNGLVGFLSPDSFRFEDKIWGYETNSIAKLAFHFAKIRLYFSFKSPYNRFETVGTHICLDDSLVTLIWRLSRPKSMKFTYALSPKTLFANFKLATRTNRNRRSLTGRIESRLTEKEESTASSEPAPVDTKEVPPPAKNESPEGPPNSGFIQIEKCLDVHVNDSGFVNQLIIRPVTSYDYELAMLRKMELENGIDEQWRRAKREEQQMK